MKIVSTIFFLIFGTLVCGQDYTYYIPPVEISKEVLKKNKIKEVICIKDEKSLCTATFDLQSYEDTIKSCVRFMESLRFSCKGVTQYNFYDKNQNKIVEYMKYETPKTSFFFKENKEQKHLQIMEGGFIYGTPLIFTLNKDVELNDSIKYQIEYVGSMLTGMKVLKKTKFVYDDYGNLRSWAVSESDLYNSSNMINSTENYEFDDDNRPLSSFYHNQKTIFDYKGNTIKTSIMYSDTLAYEIEEDYHKNKLVQRTVNNFVDNIKQNTNFKFDSLNNLIEVNRFLYEEFKLEIIYIYINNNNNLPIKRNLYINNYFLFSEFITYENYD